LCTIEGRVLTVVAQFARVVWEACARVGVQQVVTRAVKARVAQTLVNV